MPALIAKDEREHNAIDQFGFKNIISLHPPYLGGFQEHDKRWVFQTMYCFSSGTGVCLGHCIIFCLSWKPPRYGGRHALETELVYIQSRETCERKIVQKIRKCRWKLLNWPCPAANFTYFIESNYIWRLSYLNFIFRKCAESVKMGISEEYSFQHLSQNTTLIQAFRQKILRRLLVLDIFSYQV